MWKLLLISVVLVCSTASCLRIGVVVFPELGHLNPLFAVVYEALDRGYDVDLYSPDKYGTEFCGERAKLFPKLRCICFVEEQLDRSHLTDEWMQQLIMKHTLVTFAIINSEQQKVFATVLPLLIQALELHEKPDVMLVDFGSIYGVSAADKFNIPVVLLWPLTLALPTVLTNPSYPAMATGFSVHMSLTERFWNYVLQRLSLASLMLSHAQFINHERAKYGMAPIDAYDYYYRRFVITPSIFGLDMAQPLCPNIVPVGFLQRTTEVEELPESWKNWLDQCTVVIYWNMGSVAVLPTTWAHAMEDAIYSLHSQYGSCHIWKLKKMDELQHSDIPSSIRIVPRLSFSPKLLLKHPNTKLFVTHCGDTSVYESIMIGAPLVGIGLFADQPDMCARVEDAGIGRRCSKWNISASLLMDLVLDVLGDKRVYVKLDRLRRGAGILGGAKKAVDVLELARDVGVEPFMCHNVDLPWYQLYDVDVIFALFAVIATTLMVPYYLCKCAFRRRKEKIE